MPAGLVFALSAARHAKEVIFADEDLEPGGGFNSETFTLNNAPTFKRLKAIHKFRTTITP
jgi:NADPH-dependent 2,4-dienoyl-CoA reductase/sulfur reductase-like enzyme